MVSQDAWGHGSPWVLFSTYFEPLRVPPIDVEGELRFWKGTDNVLAVEILIRDIARSKRKLGGDRDQQNDTTDGRGDGKYHG